MGKYMRNGKGVEKMQEVSHFCHGHGSSLGVRTRARAALAALHEKENAIAHAMVTDSSGTPRSSSANSSINLHHARKAENSFKNTAAAMAASSSSPPRLNGDDDPRNQTCVHRMELRSCRKLRVQKANSNLIRPKCVRSNGDDGGAEASCDETRPDISQAQKIIKRSNLRGGSVKCSHDVSSSMEASAAEANHGRSFRVLRQMRSSSANSAAGFPSDGRSSLGRKTKGQELDLHIHVPGNLCSTTPHDRKANFESNLSVINPPPSPSPSIQCSAVSSPDRRIGNLRRPLGVLTRYRRQVLSSNIDGQEEADNHAATISPANAIHLHPNLGGSLSRAPVDHTEIEPCCGESLSMVAVGSLAAIARPRRHAINNNIQTRNHQRITAENSNSVQKRSDREEEYSCSIAEAPDIMEPSIPEAPGSTSKKTPYKSNIRNNCFDHTSTSPSPSPSPSPVSSACFAANNINNNDNNSNARPRSAPPFSRTSNSNYCNVREYPSSGEIEAFLANAEQQQRRRFMDRYNFDPLREKAFRGRYEWQKLID